MVTQSHKEKDRSTPYLLALLFVFLAAGIVVAGSLYYQNQKRHYRTDAEQEPSIIADLSTDDLARWWTVILVGAAFFGAGGCVGLILGRRRTQFYKERSKAAEAIRESEARFRVLFEQATDGLLLVDAETRRFILTNRQIQKMLGYSEDEFLRLGVSDIHPANDLPRVLDQFEKLVRREIAMASNIPVKHKDGTVFFTDIGSTPIRLQQRDCLLGIFRDITERKRAEEALAERTKEVVQKNLELAGTNTTLQQQIAERERIEQVLDRDRLLLRTLIDNLPDYVYAKDTEGRFVIANMGVARQLGFSSPNEVIGKSDFDLFPHELATRYHADEQEIIQSGQGLYNHEGPTVDATKEEKNRWVSTTKVPMRNAQGEITGFIGLGHDITEHKRAEEALRRSETQIHTILESTADGILAVDNQGKVIKANQRFAELWRIPQSLMKGGDDKALLDFVLDQLTDPDAFLKKVQALYKTHAIDMDTITFKDGRVFERYSSPMTMEGGVVGRVWSFRDVTEPRRLQQKLLQSRKMEAIGQLTAGIAHEFNNLLTAILGYSDLVLARLPSDSPLRRDLEQMEKASNRAVVLTRQLLTFGRKYPQELKSINLNTIVLNMQQMLQPLLGSTIRLTASLDPALNIVIADPAQMEQIIMNMAVNARDAMPHGGELTITTANVHLDEDMALRHPESVPGSYVQLTVSDTGVGMSDEVKARLFDPFFTTKPVGQGTGLGLATCIGIIRQTGGFIDVDSAPDKGTTFQIFLPQSRANTGATRPTNQ
jgi:PAS domain S-box-containing protein